MKCRPGIQYDQTHHTGCACYEKRRADEMKRLRDENDGLLALIREYVEADSWFEAWQAGNPEAPDDCSARVEAAHNALVAAVRP